MKSPKALPRPRLPLPGSPLSSGCPDRRQGPGCPFPRIFQGVPQTRGKSHAERWIRSRSVPPDRRQRFRTVNNNGIRRTSPPEARQRFRTISKDGIRLGRPPRKRGKGNSILPPFSEAGWRTQTGGRGQIMPNEAAQRIPLRYAAKAAHKRRASARHRHTPQTCGTGGARPHIKAGGRCRPSARPPPAGHPSWARNPPGRLRRPCAALPIP